MSDPKSYISQIRIPLEGGGTALYYVKDTDARADIAALQAAVAAGVQYVLAWDGNSAPDASKIPAGVKVKYNSVETTGTLVASASTMGKFYLVKSQTLPTDDSKDIYDEYLALSDGGETPSYSWEKIGDTRLKIEGIGELAYKDASDLSVAKGSGAEVLGKDATFALTSGTVSFSGDSDSDGVLGSDATFKTTGALNKTHLSAEATGMFQGSATSVTAVTSYPGSMNKLTTTSLKGVAGTDTAHAISNKVTKKLVTASVHDVTAAAYDKPSFTMGSGADAETLIVSFGSANASLTSTDKTFATGSLAAENVTENVGASLIESFTATEKTLATADASATTVATGGLSAASATENVGGSVMVGLGNAETATISNPTISIASGATGDVEIVDGLGTLGVSVDDKDEVTAITGLGSASVATGITVTSDDKKKVALYDDLGSVTAS